MIYSFIALSLPDDARDVLADLQSWLPVGRHNNPDTFHITLAYLDKQSEQTLERIHEVLSQMQLPPFQIDLGGVGVFGGKSPRVLWAGVDASESLGNLRDKIRRTAQRSGVRLARERFKPHVTLARFGGAMRPGDSAKIRDYVAQNMDFRAGPFLANDVTFYRSDRHQTGATYAPMVSYRLIG